MSGAAKEFLVASDAVLGFTEAIAKTSIDGLPTFAENIRKVAKELTPLQKRLMELGDSLNDTIKGWAGDVANVWADMVVDAERNFDRLLKSWAKTLVAMASKTLVLQPIFDQFGAFVAERFSPPVANPAAGPAFGTTIPAASFTSSGKLVSGWVPSPTRTTGGVTVVVNDYRTAGQPPQVTQGQGPDGRQMIRITLRDEVRRMIGDGSLDGPMHSNYGVSRRGAAR